MRIELQQVTKRYGAAMALDNVTLAIEPGQILALLGANGAGKTTLLRALSGLIGLGRGKILFDGEEFQRGRIDLRKANDNVINYIAGGSLFEGTGMRNKAVDKNSDCTSILVQTGSLMADNVSHLWQVEYESGIPVFRQIINQVCAAVAIGGIRSGDQLPTIRALSERLNVNPNTIAKAYRELELKGVITTERGNGSFVQDPPPASAFNEKQAKLQSLYQRMLAEAASLGLTESELLRFIQQKNPATK